MGESKLDAVLTKLAANKAAALTGALALAMGIAVGVAVDKDDPQRETKLEQLGDAIAKGSATTREAPSSMDTAAYHDAIRKVRDEDPTLVDLLSEPVAPGAEVVSGASFPAGARLVGEVELFALAAKWFVVIEARCIDREVAPDAGIASTWCEVRARNDGATAQRLTALVHFEVP